MNIKVDDMKSNTQSTVVSFLPHLAAASMFHFGVDSKFRVTASDNPTFDSMLCRLSTISISVRQKYPPQDYKLLYRAT